MGSKEENECHIKSIITIGFNNKKKTLFVKITPSVLKKKEKKSVVFCREMFWPGSSLNFYQKQAE